MTALAPPALMQIEPEPEPVDVALTEARRHPRFGAIGWLGLGIVGTFLLVAVFAPRLAGYRVTQLAGEPLRPPNAAHTLGTNLVGQDVASQMAYGARVSLFIALVAGAGTVAIGALIGIIAGWSGGRVDALLMRLVDVVLVIPSLPLLIVLGAYAGPKLSTIAIIIAATAWPPSARVIRSQVLSLRSRAHLEASVGFGAGAGHVIRRHIVPEVGLVLAASMVGAASRAVMTEAGLAFLGLGDPTRASWGKLMRDALNFPALFNTHAWAWWLIPPAMAVALLLLGLTLVGMSVEARLNTRLARHAGRSRRRS